MGRTNRRQRNAITPGGGGRIPEPGSKPKPAWRETFDSWGGFTVVGSIVAVVFVVGLLIYMNRPGSSASTAVWTPIQRNIVNGRTAGDPSAPIKIVAFEDFQCPFCKRFTHETEPKLLAEYVNSGKASLQFVPFSVLGEESKKAAEAGECAADQNRFWDYHDVLFLRQGAENSGVYTASNLKKYAREVQGQFKDFDTKKFDECLDSGTKRAIVETFSQQASGAGIRSTPTFTINGARLDGAQPIEAFREAIKLAVPPVAVPTTAPPAATPAASPTASATATPAR